MCVEGGKEPEYSSSLETSVLGPVDDAHSTNLEALKNLVVGNDFADHGKRTRA
jgi:hypothetical protein